MKVTFDKEKKLGSMKHSNIGRNFTGKTEGKLPKRVLSYDISMYCYL